MHEAAPKASHVARLTRTGRVETRGLGVSTVPPQNGQIVTGERTRHRQFAQGSIVTMISS
jgi:hypothetical protein